MTLRTILALLSALVLALGVSACGSEEQPQQGGEREGAPPPPGPSEIPKAVSPVLQPPLAIALDETSLAALLAHHEKVLAAGADVAGAMAIGAGTKRDYHWYTSALSAWRALEEATAGSDVARRELEQLDERIRTLEAEAATATGEAKTEAQRTLAITRRMRPALAKHVASQEGLDSAGNRRLVERWKPRFDVVAAKAAK